MKRSVIIALTAIVGLTACTSSVNKKVLVMGKGTLTARENKVTYKEGAGYTETTVQLSGDKESKLEVDVDGKSRTVNIPADAGFYILNLRADTVVGSKQNLGSDLNSSRTITQEELKVKIDSLTQLVSGVNNGGNNVFIIQPNGVQKVSSNVNARVFGPFTKIPAQLDADPDGKELELYKFRTNSEMRELIGTFKKMTTGE